MTSNQHSELAWTIREALLKADNVTTEGDPEAYHINREAILALRKLEEQLEAVQRQALAADRALDWIAQNHRRVIIEMPTPIFADLREAGRASNPATNREEVSRDAT